MIISTSNISDQATITLSQESELQDISVITDGDYSSVYSDTLTDSLKLTFTFDSAVDINYLAISGNISTKDYITISSDGRVIRLESSEENMMYSSDGFALYAPNPVDDSELGLSENSVMMYQTDIANTTEIEIEIFGSGQISISEIAMGDYYEIPNDGEQSGYKRAWSVPNIQTRSASGLDSSPINMSYEARALTCTLTVNNNIMSDYDGWYEFLTFASSNTFYVLEDDDKFHSYVGFNASPSMTTANGSTRGLGKSTVKFSAFAKSTESTF